MRSIRKIALLAASAAAVLAFAAPAANATQLVDSNGVPVWTGIELSMSSTNFTFKTSWGNLTCGKVTLPSRLATNTKTLVEASYTKLGSAGECWMGTKTFTLEPELRGMHLEGPGARTMNLKLKAKYPNNINCVYENTAAPVSYTSGTSVLNLINVNMTAIPAACGPFTLNSSLTVSSPSFSTLLFVD